MSSSTTVATLNWGILGPGNIARSFARGVAGSASSRVVAAGSRSLDRAQAFAEEFGFTNAYGSYEALLADPDVHAVYIATPHPEHPEWAIKTAEAGKHILCEKPIALNHAQAMAMVQAAREYNVFLMEAFMYRCHPQTAKLVELIRGGAIGQVLTLEASFSFRAGWNPESRLLSNALGGGGILDVGCYAMSMARLIAGAAAGRDFAEPVDLQAIGHLGETGVDEYASAVVRFPENIIARLSTGVRVGEGNQVRVFGSEGSITVPSPWIPARDGGAVAIHLNKGGEQETIEIATDTPLYGLEADVVANAVADGRLEAPSPAMSWDDTLGNMAALDRWRHAIGLTYQAETPEHNRPASGRTPVRRENHNMKYGRVPGLDKPVSKLVIGCDNQAVFAHSAAMFDDWFERGGNAFDTSFIYGGGQPEKLLGQWQQSRGLRDQVVFLGKGLHTPNCRPERLEVEIPTTLERMQTDHLDIYVMHRDNLEVPIEEFVDALDEQFRKGRFKAWGGSNWTIERFEAAAAYAKEHGRIAPTVLNNNLSLARMVKPVWAGCVTSSEPATLAWLKRTGTTHFAWSSQARGYFLDESLRMRLGQGNFACWDSEDNRERRRRAEAMAAEKGVTPINIAAAYVLSQPFPSFALVGPRVISETASTMPALDLELTPDELKHLNLED